MQMSAIDVDARCLSEKRPLSSTITSRHMSLLGHVARMDETNANRIFIEPTSRHLEKTTLVDCLYLVHEHL